MNTKKNYFLIPLFFLISCSSPTVINNKENLANDVIVHKTKFKPLKAQIPPGEVRRLSFSYPGDRSELKVFCKGAFYPSHLKNGKRVLYYAESYFSQEKKIQCFLGKNVKESELVVELTTVLKKYPEERLLVDKKRVTLSKKDQTRVYIEQQFLNEKYAASPERPLFEEGFLIPIDSSVTSIYGTRRIFNNHKKTQHLGTDYRAPIGDPIKASNNGRVVVSRDLFYTGKTIIIDHGLNIFTVYGHLSDIKFNEGEEIKKGQILGLSGATGRVTGPHLHWGVKVNNNYIEGDSLVYETQLLNSSQSLTYSP